MTRSEIEKAAEELAKKLYPISSIPKSAIANRTGFELLGAARKQIKEAFLAGAEHAKQAERFRIVQLISNLPDGSITSTTWGEIARLIAAREAESK